MVLGPSMANTHIQFKDDNCDEWTKAYDKNLTKNGDEEIVASSIHEKFNERSTIDKSFFCFVELLMRMRPKLEMKKL